MVALSEQIPAMSRDSLEKRLPACSRRAHVCRVILSDRVCETGVRPAESTQDHGDQLRIRGELFDSPRLGRPEACSASNPAVSA